MRDRIEALKIIGLSEEAQLKEIEERYYHLVKRYKFLAHDEQPSPSEPIFATINEAYRFLIGFTPMQKVHFRELGWKEKLEYIREYYMIEIIACVIFALLIFAAGLQIHTMNKAIQTGSTNSSITSTISNPHSDCNGTTGKFP
jgi:hypothetical protein